MGVIRPPWISKEWFTKCPFNYCDHFGNQEVLATICKICRDDVLRKKLYKKAGKDPYDWKYVFQDLADNLVRVHKMIEKDAKRVESMYLDKLDGRITADEYDKLYKVFREKIEGIDTKLANLQKAEDDYYLSVNYLLQLTQRAYDLFISSEIEEKRQILKLILQNSRLDGRLVRYDLLKPFDTLLNYADNKLVLPQSVVIRTEKYLREQWFGSQYPLQIYKFAYSGTS